MAALLISFSLIGSRSTSRSYYSNPPSPPPPSASIQHCYYYHFNHIQTPPMSHFLFLFFFFALSLISLCILLLSLYSKKRKSELRPGENLSRKISSLSETLAVNKINDRTIQGEDETNSKQLTHSLLLEILPADSTKWAKLFGEKACDDPESNESGLDRECTEKKRKKKKKNRAKKKRLECNEDEEGRIYKEGSSTVRDKEELVLVRLYPFTTSPSATRRMIEQHYDQLVKSHESNGLTLAQVAEFVNCLIEARHKLQHKSELIQRKFAITRVLLTKADRSSFDRLHQQIYKLEMEQKRLEEDVCVYNWLQQQLKLSPAYKKILEISAGVEMNAKSVEKCEHGDSDCADITFEELLAQEKKDDFWQKRRKTNLCSH